jgi:5-methylcytosine-specific restriction protein B
MSLPRNITKEHLIKAIEKIENDGIPNDANSQYYDVVFNGKKYPPKLIVSYANIFANGLELKRNSFDGGINTECFNLLQEKGFQIIKKEEMSFYNELKKFIAVSDKQLTGQGIVGVQEFNNDRILIYEDLKVEAKLGTGRASAIPWIAFLSKNDTVQKGIYPVYLYYKEENILILAYGISETKAPNRIWNLVNEIKINDYFLLNYKKNAKKYGDSSVYRVYNLKNELEEKMVNDDLNALISIYKLSLLKDNLLPGKEEFKKLNLNKSYIKQIPFNFETFQTKTLDAGLIFSQLLSQRFIASLFTKPFLICSGLSGSGKTKLAQAFVYWISENDNQYKIIPVGADWTNREPLLGYPNGLEPISYVTPDSGALQLILEASKEGNENKPYFMILDEMNLSHVERYFADFLSIMESGEKLKLYSGEKRYSKIGEGKDLDEAYFIPTEVEWPKNLFIIGTVNIDETTYMFSPKVLDRANVIEFRITPTEMKEFFIDRKPLNMEALFLDRNKSRGGAGQSMGGNFLELAQVKTIIKIPEIEGENNILNKFFAELQIVGSEFGYRSATEIELLMTKLGNDGFVDDKGEPLKNNTKIDIAIMQKLLPKLHGSRKKLVGPLETLAGFCLVRINVSQPNDQDKTKSLYQQFISEKRDPAKWEIKYSISFEKIERMLKNVIENGFTSYAEA